MQELKRRQGFARSYGIEGTELLSPTEAAERSPLLDPSTILGAYWVPSDGAAKGVKVAEALARKAEAAGVGFQGGVTVTGFEIRGWARARRSAPTAAPWSASGCCCVPASGGRRSARSPVYRSRSSRCSTSWSGPTRSRSSPASDGDTWAQQPVVRHQDMSLYFRQRDDHYGVGNYRHEPIVTPQSSIRRPAEEPRSPLQPSLMPFTPDDFDVCEAETARMFPALAGSHATQRPGAHA